MDKRKDAWLITLKFSSEVLSHATITFTVITVNKDCSNHQQVDYIQVENNNGG